MMRAMNADLATDPIGVRIARRRQQLRLTQAQLAERVGVSKTSVGKWESGAHYPSRHLGALEEALDMRLSGETEFTPDLADPAEAALWAMPGHSPEWRRKFIEELRLGRAQTGS